MATLTNEYRLTVENEAVGRARMMSITVPQQARDATGHCLSPAIVRRLAWIESVWVKIGVIVLVLLDLCFLIVELADSDQEDTAMVATWVILGLFWLEVLIRMLYMAWEFFADLWSVFDVLVILVSTILAAVSDQSETRLVVLLRLLRAGRVIFLCYRQRTLCPKAVRQKVSQNRRRFQRDGFDIDITYITNRMIAMSVPAKSMEALYRNPAPEVARFFNTRHTDRYRLYNLCPERQYDYTLFQDRVHEYFMMDHNPAPLRQILALCADVHTFMRSDDTHVVAIHCKGGKGRTGTMLCSYLLYDGIMDTARDSLEFFASRRTSDDGDREGVEARSQTRYVEYIQALVQCGMAGALPVQVMNERRLQSPYSVNIAQPAAVRIHSIRVHGLGPGYRDPAHWWFCVAVDGTDIVYDHSPFRESHSRSKGGGDYLEFEVADGGLVVAGDLCVTFHCTEMKLLKQMFRKKAKKYKLKKKKSKKDKQEQGSLEMNALSLMMEGDSTSESDFDEDVDHKTHGRVETVTLARFDSAGRPAALGRPKHCVFGYWVHTSFLYVDMDDVRAGNVGPSTQHDTTLDPPVWSVGKSVIDGVRKCKDSQAFPEDAFRIEMVCVRATGPVTQAPSSQASKTAQAPDSTQASEDTAYGDAKTESAVAEDGAGDAVIEVPAESEEDEEYEEASD